MITCVCNLKDTLKGGYAWSTHLCNEENDSIVQSGTAVNLVRNKRQRAWACMLDSIGRAIRYQKELFCSHMCFCHFAPCLYFSRWYHEVPTFLTHNKLQKMQANKSGVSSCLYFVAFYIFYFVSVCHLCNGNAIYICY